MGVSADVGSSTEDKEAEDLFILSARIRGLLDPRTIIIVIIYPEPTRTGKAHVDTSRSE